MNIFLLTGITGGCAFVFYLGITGLNSGNIYCKGAWYKRDESPINYWASVISYLVFPPVILLISLFKMFKGS